MFIMNLDVLAEVCGEERYMPRVTVCSGKNKVLPPPQWKGLSIINLPQVSCWIDPGNGTILWARSWAGICCWKIGYSAIVIATHLNKQKPMLLSPGNLSASHMATLFMNPLNNTRNQEGKGYS